MWFSDQSLVKHTHRSFVVAVIMDLTLGRVNPILPFARQEKPFGSPVWVAGLFS